MEASSAGLKARIDRRIGRPSRVSSLSIRFTLKEEAALKKLAAEQGKTVREWAREAILHELQPVQMDTAIFTELMAMRLFVNGALRELALGRTMTEKQYAAHLAEARKSKHQTASEVLLQYRSPSEGAQ